MNRRSELIRQFKSYLVLKNYADNSIKQYTSAIGYFYKFCDDQHYVTPTTHEQVREYLLYRHDTGCSWSLINTQYSGIKIYFINILNIEWDSNKIPRPRNQKKLPNLLSKQEIKKIIECATLFKHQALLTLLYATGIRISELCNLELKDIHGDRLQMHVRLGKGYKDRIVNIPKQVLEMLRSYYKRCKPEIYLFNGQHSGDPISKSAVAAAIRNARHRANIIKPVTAHTFRHCYATHHLEAGTNLVYLQKELGHNNLKTTAKYIRLAQNYRLKVVHPIDSLRIDYHKENRPSVNYLETLARLTSITIPPAVTR